MTEFARAQQPEARTSEWSTGWPIVLACSLGNGTGVVLLFFTFSLVMLPLIEELGGTRSAFASIQALVATGALSAPLMGRLTDQYGFRRVFLFSLAAIILVELSVVFLVQTMTAFAVCVGLLGLSGVGTTALTTTRPVNAHFDRNRGLALGIVAAGVSITTIIFPPLLESIVAEHGWRAAIFAIAMMSALIGFPAIFFLVKEAPQPVRTTPAQKAVRDYSFLSSRDFWLMTGASMVMSMAGSGFVGQLSPMIQEEGLSPATAALGLSLFAVGQLTGRLGGGWFLDRFDPRIIAIVFTILPGSGFLLLLGVDGVVAVALAGAFLIGLQQGAEVDIFAYFIARRFDLARYGTIYGTLIGLSWIGTATGVLGVGHIHDQTGSYDLAQLIGAVALAIGTVLLALIHLPSRATPLTR